MSDTPDPAEFVRLLSLNERRLSAFIYSLVPNWTETEEIAQETKVRLWEQFAEYDPAKDFGAWSRTIAFYQVLTYRKQSRRQHAQLSDELLRSVASEIARATDELDARHGALAFCLDKLAATDRRVLLGYYSTEQTMRQFAAELGRSYEAVRKSVLRMRGALAECVRQRLAQQESK